jgi:hypothetical protein
MSKKRISVATLLLAVIAITASAACQSSTPPAKFEINSLNVKPSEVDIGEKAVISAQVTNTGGAGGIYGVGLYVDGKRIDTKDVSLDPGFSQTVNFSLSKAAAGTYEIGVGKSTATLTVKSKLVAQQVELEYDGGVAKDYLSLVKPATGYLVGFESPPDPFTISKVRVFGLIYGSPGYHVLDSDLEIWDKDQKVLYTTSFTGDQFPLRTRLGDNIDSRGAWADIEIPDVKVEGNFYIHIYTGVPTGQGFRMGAGSATINNHSDVTVRDANSIDTIALKWPYMPVYWYGDQSRVNWMVRVIGNAMVSQ